MAISPDTRLPSDEPEVALLKVGPEDNERLLLSYKLPLLKVSVSVSVPTDVLPLFSTVIVKTTISPTPGKLSPLASTKTPVLVTSKPEVVAKFVIVASLVVFPSKSLPSSLISETSLEFPGLLPKAEAVLETEPELTSPGVMV